MAPTLDHTALVVNRSQLRRTRGWSGSIVTGPPQADLNLASTRGDRSSVPWPRHIPERGRLTTETLLAFRNQLRVRSKLLVCAAV